MQVRIINKSNNPLPAYETAGSAGMDLRAYIDADITVKAGARLLVPTGIHIELPDGYEAQIRPRSGMAFKHGISLPNTPATIDSDYRGEVKVAVINLSQEDFVIKSGDRIAQMVIAKYERVQWEATAELSETQRGHGGFGHTGK